MFSKKKTLIWVASLLNALLMAGFTFFWLRQPYWSGDEFALIRYTSIFKRLILPLEDFPPRERFLFVTLSWDKKLIEKSDADGFPIGYQPITDRKKLADFFSILAKKPDNHKFVICDVFFKDPSPDDSLLVASINKVPNVLCSYHKGDDDQPEYPALNVPRGLSDYETAQNGTFVKFKLVQNDTLRSLPLLMYEKIYRKKFKEGLWCDSLGGTPILNAFILDHRIRNFQLQTDTMYSRIYFGEELLMLPEEEIYAMTKDRIVIMGDFEDQDIHETVYGDTPGPLILLNAFLAIEAGDNRLSMWFLVFILTGYTLVSFKCFSENDLIERWVEKWSARSSFLGLALGVVSYALVLIVMSVISYFLFNVHLTILLLALYMNFLEKAVKFFRVRIYEKYILKKTSHLQAVES